MGPKCVGEFVWMRKNTGGEAERAKTVRGRELRPGERERVW